MLTVANTGLVIPPGEVPSLLIPFQRGAVWPPRMRTTAASGHGLGLGLPIVQAIAIAHSADLILTARPEGGLAAELAFPAARPAWYVREAAAGAPAAAENVPGEADLTASAQHLRDVNPDEG